MLSNPQPQDSGPPRRRRLKISYACQSCRSRKVKCDGVRPECSHCQKSFRLRGTCTYTSKLGEAPHQRLPEQLQGPSESTEQLEESQRDEAQENYCSSTPGVFAGEIKAAIDARLGLPVGGKMSLIPMTDAPLFGPFSRPQATDNNTHHVDNLLPPRKQADYLVDMYWRHIQPLEPFLDPEQFPRSYQALFAGSPLREDERTFLSTLNTIFAISTQLQEDLLCKQRNEASNAYFQRAWTLLRPDMILWEPGSLGLVQCLLLMSRYLQCTNSPHQTWMAVGSAVRIAQSLGLHLPESSSLGPLPVGDSIDYGLAKTKPKVKLNPYSIMSSTVVSPHESRMRRHLWQCCVFMDRVTSWASGRMSIVPLTSTDSLNNHGPEGQSADYFSKLLELYEISNHVMLSQTATASSFAEKLGLPRLYQNDDYLSRAVKLNVSLHKWEKSLHRSLRLDDSQGDAGDASHRQRVILRLRLLHARILLFRPMLARFCLSQPQTSTNSLPESSLSDRILQSSASLCLENAQQMITLVSTYQSPNSSISIMPWWNRILYLHVAGTTLIAATLRSDLFTPSVSQSWNQAMQLLREHAYLSPFVEQCVDMFQSLSTRILETHHSNEDQFSTQDGALNMYFQDVFQDLAFDPDSFLFGKEDMSWWGGFEAGQGVV